MLPRTNTLAYSAPPSVKKKTKQYNIEPLTQEIWRKQIGAAQHNDIQHNETQHKGLIYDTQHKWQSA